MPWLSRGTRAPRALARRWARELQPARRLRFQLVSEVVERFGARELTILDAGCGEGILAAALAQAHPDWTVVAVDTNEEMLRRGRERIARDAIANVDLRHDDVTKPLDSSLYDIVLAVECLEEVEDDKAALASLAGCLRPGGLFVAHVPERDWVPVLPGSERTWRCEVRHGYSEDELVDELSRVGLHVLSVRPTSRGTVRLVQELIDHVKTLHPAARAALYPLTALAIWLERHGLTWGPPRALLVQAVKQRPDR